MLSTSFATWMDGKILRLVTGNNGQLHVATQDGEGGSLLNAS